MTPNLILSYYDKSAQVMNTKIKCSLDRYAEFSLVHNSSYILSDKMPRLLAPKRVKVKAMNSKSIELSWNRVAGATGYSIYRASKKNGKYKKIKTIKKQKTIKYKDKSVKCGTRYYYRIKANGYSEKTKAAFSAKVSARPMPVKVNSIHIDYQDNNTLDLYYSGKDQYINYEVYISKKKRGKYKFHGKSRYHYYTLKKKSGRKIYYVKVKGIVVYKGKKYNGAFSKPLKIKL